MATTNSIILHFFPWAICFLKRTDWTNPAFQILKVPIDRGSKWLPNNYMVTRWVSQICPKWTNLHPIRSLMHLSSPCLITFFHPCYLAGWSLSMIASVNLAQVISGSTLAWLRLSWVEFVIQMLPIFSPINTGGP